MPTDAEWEYCCRAGTRTTYSFGNDARLLGQHAWFNGNADGKPHPVGRLKPNAWGLYDMHGHVWQWTADRFDKEDKEFYKRGPKEDPVGPLRGDDHMLRGGSFAMPPELCRSASRKGRPANYATPHSGFRVVCDP